MKVNDRSELGAKMRTATKWSAVTQLLAKLVSPITTMALARLLTPDAFGIVATLTMVISFAEIFTDAGFQKYVVQHQFKDERDQDESINVAFWSNLIMSLFLWGIIALFSSPLAKLVGNPGYGYVLIIACVSIPIAAFSTIQSALYNRKLDYKTLFKVRIVSAMVPLFITVPLAFLLRNFWALVVGTILQNVVSAVLLTYHSAWKPRLFYSVERLREMLSFSIWSMVEQVSIWLTNYVDVFIVGTALSQYYLGLYRTGSSIVGQITGLITAITTPILFSSLSRLQDEKNEFLELFFRFQKIVGLLIIPLGVGIFIFRDFITTIILGSQWGEAAYFIGLWGLTSSITIILSHYSSEVYRAKGKPKLSVLAQLLHIIVLWPTVLLAVKYGFETLCTARAIVRLELIVVNLFIMYYLVKMPVAKLFTNVLPSLIASCAMFVVILLPKATALWQNVLYAVLASAIFCGVIMIFPKERNILLNLKTYLRK